MAKYAVRTESLSKTCRKGKDNEVPAVIDVGLNVASGQAFGFLGPSGAGKTITLKMICGLVRPTVGTAWINGVNVWRHRSAAVSQIGAVLEGARNIHWAIPAWDNVMWFGMLRGMSGRRLRSRSEELLRQVELCGFGYLIGGVVLIYKQMESLANLLSNAMLFLNGTMLPVALMPGWLAAIARMLPTTQGVMVLSSVVLEGQSLGEAWADGSLLWLVVHSSLLLIRGSRSLLCASESPGATVRWDSTSTEAGRPGSSPIASASLWRGVSSCAPRLSSLRCRVHCIERTSDSAARGLRELSRYRGMRMSGCLGLSDGCHSRARLSGAELEALLALVSWSIVHCWLNEPTLCDRPGNRTSDLLWVEDERLLVGYLGLFQFLPDTVEVNGLVHPEWRRHGIFSRLWKAARAECLDRGASRALLICEKRALPGHALIRCLGAVLETTEYKLAWQGAGVQAREQPLSDTVMLRAAVANDIPELAAQNAAYFGEVPEHYEKSMRQGDWPPLTATEGRRAYLAELDGVPVGKVDIGIADGEAWIYGLGIREEWRGHGHGRALLQGALRLLAERGARRALLEVEARNARSRCMRLAGLCPKWPTTITPWIWLPAEGAASSNLDRLDGMWGKACSPKAVVRRTEWTC